jgi:hypothetical protein
MDFEKNIKEMDDESYNLYELIDGVIADFIDKHPREEEEISLVIMSAIANTITKLLCIMEMDREFALEMLNDILPDNESLRTIIEDNEDIGKVIPIHKHLH